MWIKDVLLSSYRSTGLNLLKRYSDLNLEDDEIDAIVHNLLYARGHTLYATMKATLAELRNGYTLDRSKYGKKTEFIELAHRQKWNLKEDISIKSAIIMNDALLGNLLSKVNF